MNPMTYILAVMLSAGLFGGLINYHLENSEQDSKRNLWRSLIVGIGASFLVPLFLNMISSNLLDVIRGSSATPSDLSKLFVFAGFCLVASISSKAFITTISDRVLREARETRREVAAAKAELADVQAVIEPIIARETESDLPETQTVRLQATHVEHSPEQMVLNALIPGRWSLRSLSGLAKETAMDSLEVSRILDDLTQRGFVARRTSKNGPRWFITEDGRNAISG